MQLNFKKFGEGFPVIILHGVLGSLDNWQTVAKKLAESPFAVYILDQRNHGRSPHSEDFNYDLLTKDLMDFMAQQGIAKAHFIGHSMGGKVAMKFALEHPVKVEKLIVVDIAPGDYGDTDDSNEDVLDALEEADVHNATNREQIEKTLRSELGNEENTIQFLMKGLSRDDAGVHFEWKFNLDAIAKNYHEIAGPIENDWPFLGPTLFIKGEKSKYINAGNYSNITDLFPNNTLTEIKGAGHWVHADKGNEFVVEVMKFLSKV